MEHRRGQGFESHCKKKGIFILQLGWFWRIDGGIPHREASMRVGEKLALNRAIYEERKHTLVGVWV